MHSLLMPLAEVNLMWYSVPLIVAISLVYSATRHEQLAPIFSHATRLAIMIAGFMAVILVVLAIISNWL
jgi:heme/copper-type cytochrome/quinol oxidase subunit 2